MYDEVRFRLARFLWRLAARVDPEVYALGERLVSEAELLAPHACRVPAAPPCCRWHSRTCTPHEVCCRFCVESEHPAHDDGTFCANPDLSSGSGVD